MTDDSQLLLDRFQADLVRPGGMDEGIRRRIRRALTAERSPEEPMLRSLDRYLVSKARPGMRVLAEQSRDKRTWFFAHLSEKPALQLQEVQQTPTDGYGFSADTMTVTA